MTMLLPEAGLPPWDQVLAAAYGQPAPIPEGARTDERGNIWVPNGPGVQRLANPPLREF